MRSIQNAIIISFCADSGHTLFISFCANGIRSVLNYTHFVLCYDRCHIYSIVLILVNMFELRNF